jgi:hypothetical protein
MKQRSMADLLNALLMRTQSHNADERPQCVGWCWVQNCTIGKTARNAASSLCMCLYRPSVADRHAFSGFAAWRQLNPKQAPTNHFSHFQGPSKHRSLCCKRDVHHGRSIRLQKRTSRLTNVCRPTGLARAHGCTHTYTHTCTRGANACIACVLEGAELTCPYPPTHSSSTPSRKLLQQYSE